MQQYPYPRVAKRQKILNVVLPRNEGTGLCDNKAKSVWDSCKIEAHVKWAKDAAEATNATVALEKATQDGDNGYVAAVPLCLATTNNNKSCIHPRKPGYVTCHIAEHREQDASLQPNIDSLRITEDIGTTTQEDVLSHHNPDPTGQAHSPQAGAGRWGFQGLLEGVVDPTPTPGAENDQDVRMPDD
ncbi:MAG: hypothetical protein Q9166_004030 [cf. Caloplaca sp. 2 TL-2023]